MLKIDVNAENFRFYGISQWLKKNDPYEGFDEKWGRTNGDSLIFLCEAL